MKPIGESLIKIIARVKTNRDEIAHRNELNLIKHLRN